MKIAEIIIKGCKNAISLSKEIENTREYITTRIIEYFITVKVIEQLYEAKSMQESEAYNIDKITPEKSRKQTANEAFPIYSWENIFEAGKFRIPTDVGNQKERFDIVLSTKYEMGYLTKHIIEIKAVNPSKKLIKKDFHRLAEVMVKTNKSGSNNIKSSYLNIVYQILQNKALTKVTEKTKDSIINKKKKLIEKILNELLQMNENNDQLHAKIYEDIFEYYPTEHFNGTSDFYDAYDIEMRTGITFTFVVEIKRK